MKRITTVAVTIAVSRLQRQIYYTKYELNVFLLSFHVRLPCRFFKVNAGHAGLAAANCTNSRGADLSC